MAWGIGPKTSDRVSLQLLLHHKLTWTPQSWPVRRRCMTTATYRLKMSKRGRYSDVWARGATQYYITWQETTTTFYFAPKVDFNLPQADLQAV
jgi:hypothetical protein